MGLGTLVAKKRDKKPTAHIRVTAELAEEVYWVTAALQVTSSTLMERLLRPQISTLYHEHKALIEQLKKNAAKNEDEK